ncbi:MAG: hypothetical protein K2Q06_05635, partial [Parvularculaceae bacterium]|nr:hypothetical protein [Parvularculaceae bacterium]
WIKSGVTWSSNLPGVDGTVLNGSLLPGRLELHDRLTPHWSVLTAFGDGMIYARGFTPEEAAYRIEAYVARIQSEDMPGVVILNLHPANVDRTAPLHEALHRMRDRGALIWSLADCSRWFEAKDAQTR